MWVSEWVCHKTSWTLYKSQSLTDLHQTCRHSSVPGDVITYCFWWKFGILMSVKPEVELILPLLLWKIRLTSDISKMVKNTMMDSERKLYRKLTMGFRLPLRILTPDALNCSSSRSLRFHSKYFENVTDDSVNWSRTGNYPLAIDWYHDRWPWMTFNCPRCRSHDFSRSVIDCDWHYEWKQHWADTRSMKYIFVYLYFVL